MSDKIPTAGRYDPDRVKPSLPIGVVDTHSVKVLRQRVYTTERNLAVLKERQRQDRILIYISGATALCCLSGFTALALVGIVQ